MTNLASGLFITVIARSKRDGTRAETGFGPSAKRRSPFKSARVSFQSTTGSRGVRYRGQQLYRPCSDIQCKTIGYPLHSHLSPSLPLPCVTVCHQVLNALYAPSIVTEDSEERSASPVSVRQSNKGTLPAFQWVPSLHWDAGNIVVVFRSTRRSSPKTGIAWRVWGGF